MNINNYHAKSKNRESDLIEQKDQLDNQSISILPQKLLMSAEYLDWVTGHSTQKNKTKKLKLEQPAHSNDVTQSQEFGCEKRIRQKRIKTENMVFLNNKGTIINCNAPSSKINFYSTDQLVKSKNYETCLGAGCKTKNKAVTRRQNTSKCQNESFKNYFSKISKKKSAKLISKKSIDTKQDTKYFSPERTISKSKFSYFNFRKLCEIEQEGV